MPSVPSDGVCLVLWCEAGRGGVVFPLYNPSHPAVGPKASHFLAALMGRSGLVKHRSSPLRCGRVVQSSSKGGDWPQVGRLSVIAMEDHLDLCCHQCHPHCQRSNVCLCVCLSHGTDSGQFILHPVTRGPPTCAAAPSSAIHSSVFPLFHLSWSDATVCRFSPGKDVTV